MNLEDGTEVRFEACILFLKFRNRYDSPRSAQMSPKVSFTNACQVILFLLARLVGQYYSVLPFNLSEWEINRKRSQAGQRLYSRILQPDAPDSVLRSKVLPAPLQADSVMFMSCLIVLENLVSQLTASFSVFFCSSSDLRCALSRLLCSSFTWARKASTSFI